MCFFFNFDLIDHVVVSLLAAGHQRFSSAGFLLMFASTTSSLCCHSTATCSNATKRVHEIPTPRRCISRSRRPNRRCSEYIDCLTQPRPRDALHCLCLGRLLVLSLLLSLSFPCTLHALFFFLVCTVSLANVFTFRLMINL